MKHTATSILLTGALGLGGLATGIVVAPAIASAATTDATATEAVGNRVAAIKDALSGLVGDGSLTQAQADEVAATLAERFPEGRHGGHGGPRRGVLGTSPEQVATVLGTTPEELRTALSSGQSLADVAEDQGIAKATLIAELVKAAEAHLAEHVAEGSLTQAEADERKAELTEFITAAVEREGLPMRHGRGGFRAPDASTAPGASPSTPS
jgi:hypothetical protein